MKPCIGIIGWLFGHYWIIYIKTDFGAYERINPLDEPICKRCGATPEDVK